MCEALKSIVCVAQNFDGRKLLVDMVVHSQSTKVLSAKHFILVDLLCNAANLPMFFH